MRRAAPGGGFIRCVSPEEERLFGIPDPSPRFPCAPGFAPIFFSPSPSVEALRPPHTSLHHTAAIACLPTELLWHQTSDRPRRRNDDAVRTQDVADVRPIGAANAAASNPEPEPLRPPTAYPAVSPSSHSRYTVRRCLGRETTRLNILRARSPKVGRRRRLRPSDG